MSDLTENEVLDRLKSSLKEAGQAAVTLSLLTRIGPAYTKLREHLLLVEGCCRQIAAMRDDARWYPLGMLMAEAHKRSGNWLRGFKFQGKRIYINGQSRNQNFTLLAQNLAFMLVGVEKLQHDKTGVRGPILPDVGTEHRAVGAPVPVSLPDHLKVSAGGVILPSETRH